MLTQVRLEDWRGHRDTTVPLAPFTVLVGANAVGKTAVLEAIHTFCATFDANAPLNLRAPGFVVRYGAAKSRISVRFEQPPLVGVEIAGQAGADRNRFSIHLEGIPPPNVPTQKLDRATAYGSQFTREARSLRPLVLGLSPSRIATPARIAQTRPDPTGFGSPAAIANLHNSVATRDALARIIENARAVVPSLVDIGVTPTRSWFDTITQDDGADRLTRQREFDAYTLELRFADGAILPAEAASEGTLLAIGAMTALECARDATVLLIDDIDRGLHVEAQAAYIKVLRAQQEKRPDLQIVATTHSPMIVEHFQDDEVVAMARAADGRIAAKRLSEHPRRGRFRSLTTAEFWVAELERWVLG